MLASSEIASVCVCVSFFVLLKIACIRAQATRGENGRGGGSIFTSDIHRESKGTEAVEAPVQQSENMKAAADSMWQPAHMYDISVRHEDQSLCVDTPRTRPRRHTFERLAAMALASQHPSHASPTQDGDVDDPFGATAGEDDPFGVTEQPAVDAFWTPAGTAPPDPRLAVLAATRAAAAAAQNAPEPEPEPELEPESLDSSGAGLSSSHVRAPASNAIYRQQREKLCVTGVDVRLASKVGGTQFFELVCHRGDEEPWLTQRRCAATIRIPPTRERWRGASSSMCGI